MPIKVSIDSETKACSVRQKMTFSAEILFRETVMTQVRVMGIKVKPSFKKRKQERSKKRKKRRSLKSFSSRSFLRACTKSFSVKKVYVDLDTDDFVLNGYLYPLAVLATNREKNRRLQINFKGVVILQIEMEIRLYFIVLAIIKNSIKR